MNKQDITSNSRPKPKTGSRKKVQVRTVKGTYSTRLTKKQKAFADLYIANPKAPNTDIVKMVYNVTDTNNANQIARQNLQSPTVQIYLNSHVDKAKERIIELIDSKREDIALRASQDVIDRTHGKPTQIQQSQSVSFVQHLNSKQIDI